MKDPPLKRVLSFRHIKSTGFTTNRRHCLRSKIRETCIGTSQIYAVQYITPKYAISINLILFGIWKTYSFRRPVTVGRFLRQCLNHIFDIGTSECHTPWRHRWSPSMLCCLQQNSLINIVYPQVVFECVFWIVTNWTHTPTPKIINLQTELIFSIRSRFIQFQWFEMVPHMTPLNHPSTTYGLGVFTIINLQTELNHLD